MNEALRNVDATGADAASPRCVSAAATHPGKVRAVNEDSCLARPEVGIFAVADGVGGAHKGEHASGLVAACLKQVTPAPTPARFLSAVRSQLAAANGMLRAEAAERGEEFLSASTVVTLLLHGGRFAGIWAGDSRLYQLREGRFRQLTRDHTQVQEMVEAGVLSEAEARVDPRGNVITQAVGVQDELEVEVVEGDARVGDIFVLCSDGLTKVVEDAEIAWLVERLAPRAAVDALVEATLDRGAPDNVTVVVVRILAPAPRHG